MDPIKARIFNLIGVVTSLAIFDGAVLFALKGDSLIGILVPIGVALAASSGLLWFFFNERPGGQLSGQGEERIVNLLRVRRLDAFSAIFWVAVGVSVVALGVSFYVILYWPYNMALGGAFLAVGLPLSYISCSVAK